MGDRQPASHQAAQAGGDAVAGFQLPLKGAFAGIVLFAECGCQKKPALGKSLSTSTSTKPRPEARNNSNLTPINSTAFALGVTVHQDGDGFAGL